MSSLRRLFWWASPAMFVGGSITSLAFGCLLCLWFSLAPVDEADMTPHRHPWTSLAFGCLVGLIVSLPLKRWLRKKISLYVDFYTMPAHKRRRWEVQKGRWLEILLLSQTPVVVAMLTTHLLQLSLFPAICGVMIMLGLIYPEQKAIYEAAKRRLEERQRKVLALARPRRSAPSPPVSA